MQVTALYVITSSGKKTPSKDIEQNFPLWAGIIALILIIFLFIKFKEYSVLQKAKVVEDDLPDDDFHNWATAQS